MKEACPEYINKVRLVAGDCGLPKLGLGNADSELLCQEVNIVFHIAATVRFDEALRTAIHVNVRCTKYMLELAGRMPHLKVQSVGTRPAKPRPVVLILRQLVPTSADRGVSRSQRGRNLGFLD
jgi:fatty acyl-CoA reductase